MVVNASTGIDLEAALREFLREHVIIRFKGVDVDCCLSKGVKDSKATRLVEPRNKNQWPSKPSDGL